MAINASLAGGEDGYPKIVDHPGFVNIRHTGADALWTFVENNSPIRTGDYQVESVVR